MNKQMELFLKDICNQHNIQISFSEDKKTTNRYYFGPFKSYLQKLIRRGYVENALGVIKFAWKNGYDVEILRRLPIIAVEDVNYSYIVPTMKLYEKRKTINIQDVGRIVKSMCEYKEKTRKVSSFAYYSMDTYNPSVESNLDVIKKKLEQKDVFNTVYLIVNYVLDNNKSIIRKNAEEVWKMLFQYSRTDIYELYRYSKYRFYMGGMTGDMLCMFSAFVYSIINGIQNIYIDNREIIDFSQIPDYKSIFDLEWYAFDIHTALGKSVIKQVAEKHNLPFDYLKFLFYFCEGCNGVNYDFDTEEINKKLVFNCFGKYNIKNMSQAFREYNKYKIELKNAIESKLRKRG